jgi:hypothetical protein
MHEAIQDDAVGIATGYALTPLLAEGETTSLKI